MDVTTSTDNVSCNKFRDINIISYNSTGWGTIKADCINTLLMLYSVSIFAVQEHFQLRPNLYKLQNGISPDYELFAIPAQKSISEVHAGRPSGGICFYYRKNMNTFVTQMRVPNSYRVQGLKVSCPGKSVLFINSYFPTDTRGLDDTHLLQTLQDIKYLIDQCDNDTSVVLMGDINTDFTELKLHNLS